MEIINEPFTPLSPAEIERGRSKVGKGYPPAEYRLTLLPEQWAEMYYNNAIAIPDGLHHITGHPGHGPASSSRLYEPIYTPDNPMPIDEAKLEFWTKLGVLMDPEGRRPALDTANRPLHPRAPQMLTTVGMYTGRGFFRYYGPNPVGNFGLRLVRKDVVYYVTVTVERGESRLRISLPGGHAEADETAFQAAITEFGQETGADLACLGRVVLSAHVTTRPHPFWKNTLHAFTSEQYLFGHSEEDPGLDGLVLKTKDPGEVKQLQLMSLDDIRQHPDFLGAHRKQIEKHEERLKTLHVRSSAP